MTQTSADVKDITRLGRGTRLSDWSGQRPDSPPESQFEVITGGSSRLVGRARELHMLDTFLDQSLTLGAALWLVGEPGVGKSALLDSVARAGAAAGAIVLRAAGVEFETDLPF